MIAFPLEIYSESLKDHISNTKRVQRIVLMPSGHPIILLKSNYSILGSSPFLNGTLCYVKQRMSMFLLALNKHNVHGSLLERTP